MFFDPQINLLSQLLEVSKEKEKNKNKKAANLR